MNVKDRIKQAPACEVINLSDAEKDIYSGAGWKLARFVDGQLADFFDPKKIGYNSNRQAMADEAADAAIAWLANAEGEVWLAMCSSYQLCEPRRIESADAAAIAHMLRVFADQFA
jgi:hypothetical protein